MSHKRTEDESNGEAIATKCGLKSGFRIAHGLFVDPFITGLLGRVVKEFAWWFVPFYARLLFTSRETKKRVWNELKLGSTIPLRSWAIHRTVLGMPPIFGTAPYTETSFSLSTFIQLLKLIAHFIIGIPFIAIAFVPGLCALFPLWTWMLSAWSSYEASVNSIGDTSKIKIYYINGIMNTYPIAKTGADRLSSLLGQKVTLLYNPTQGMFIDLIECIWGRTLNWPTMPALFARVEIEKDLTHYEKVLVISHSQGCIIAASILQSIRDDYEKKTLNSKIREALKNHKLEFYLFASPATDVPNIDGNVHTEFFANTDDLVAEVGILAPSLSPKSGDPKRIFKLNRKGHLLNEHYLRDWDVDWDSQLPPYKNSDAKGPPSLLYKHIKNNKHGKKKL